MIKVSLIANTNEIPVNLSSHAARTCYTSKVPEMGNVLDVENSLFRTGHHTTLQHNYFTFNIDGMSIASATFGLHLASPFYNSDQRSGRYSKMYSKSDFEEIKSYILKYWKVENIDEILSFIEKGTKIYQENIEKATEIAKKLIKEERPFVDDESLEKLAPKIAQEQLRMFISTISPTGLDTTLNLSAITALWRSAWNPEMVEITNQMRDIILEKYPDLSYMFEEKFRRTDTWAPEIDFSHIGILKEPKCYSAKFSIWNLEIGLDEVNKDAVDVRYFTPEKMDNNVSNVFCEIEVSIATYAQDQRHRTIKRGIPRITGNFYLPPILQELDLEKVAFDYTKEYFELCKKIDKTLSIAIAPYGIMVRYKKLADLNAFLHEQEKRLCWCAQEEIYNVNRQLHDLLIEKDLKIIADVMCPACYKKACIEGKRYCGRDLKQVRENKKIPIRKI